LCGAADIVHVAAVRAHGSGIEAITPKPVIPKEAPRRSQPFAMNRGAD
jgi:hypothetical protein